METGWIRASVLALGIATAALQALPMPQPVPTQAPLPPGVILSPNLVYAAAGDRSLALDLYAPEHGEGPFGAVVLIHGERPAGRQRRDYRGLASFLAARGDLVAAAIDYRSAAEAAYPAAIEDAKAAVRWLRTHAASYRINPRMIGAGGDNFGGYVAAMLGLRARGDAAVQAVVTLPAVTDLATFAPPPDGYPYRYALFLRYPRDQRPDLWREASPLTHAMSADIPFLLVHGTNDTAVPPAQSKTLADALRAAGANVHVLEVEDAGNLPLDDARAGARVTRRVAQFLSRALWEPPPGVVMEEDVVYASPGGRDLRLDLFRPATQSSPRAAVVFAHGGGWLWGDKRDHREAAAYLASRGFVTASVEYRLARERIYPAPLDDLKAAIGWLRANAARYGIDPARIGAAGSSAGGHLAAMLGVAVDGQPPAVQAVAAFAAPVDLVSQYDRDRFSPALLVGAGNPADHPERWIQASPVTHVNSRAAAFLFLHGSADELVSHADAMRMAEALKADGVRVDFHTAEDGTHDFMHEHPWRWPALRRMAGFFAETLKPPAAR